MSRTIEQNLINSTLPNTFIYCTIAPALFPKESDCHVAFCVFAILLCRKFSTTDSIELSSFNSTLKLDSDVEQFIMFNAKERKNYYKCF